MARSHGPRLKGLAWEAAAIAPWNRKNSSLEQELKRKVQYRDYGNIH